MNEPKQGSNVYDWLHILFYLFSSVKKNWVFVGSLLTISGWLISYVIATNYFSRFDVDFRKLAYFTDYFVFLSHNLLLLFSVLAVLLIFVYMILLSISKHIENKNKIIWLFIGCLAPFVLVISSINIFSDFSDEVKNGFVTRHTFTTPSTSYLCAHHISNIGDYSLIWDYNFDKAILISKSSIESIEVVVPEPPYNKNRSAPTELPPRPGTPYSSYNVHRMVDWAKRFYMECPESLLEKQFQNLDIEKSKLDEIRSFL
ncbi:MAG: hypothetical protein HWE27_12185 [Gammaproteobacteria bacterium]|nr:hypothetical protein [Gammaproteobacteria bacterium]